MKYIFLDIDGTLLEAHKGIPDSAIEALDAARKNGHQVFLCTGRSRNNLSGAEKLPLDGAICSAGAFIEVHHQIIYKDPLSDEDVYKLESALNTNGVMYQLETKETVYQDIRIMKALMGDSGKSKQLNREMKELVLLQQKHKGIKELSHYQGEDVYKIGFMTDNLGKIKRVEEVYRNDYRFTYTGQIAQMIHGDINKWTTSQGLAIRKVVSFLHGNMRDTIAFGDSLTDLDMLHNVHYGIAMGNSDPKLIKYADDVCEDLEDDGIYKEFKRLNLI